MGRRKPRDETWRPKHLSHSSVSLYERCPAAYKLKYIDGVEEPPNAPMLFGRAMAKSLEVAHLGGDARLTFCEEYTKACEVIRKFDSYMYIRPEMGFDILNLYLDRLAEGVPEKRFKVYLPNRDEVPVPIVGYMDLMTPREIYEFKTSAGGWDQERADNSHQNHLYGYAFKQEKGFDPDCVRFIVLGTRVMQLDEYITHPTQAGLDYFCQLAANCWKSLETQDFPFVCGKCGACRIEKAKDKLAQIGAL
jgi:hypothetical protein